MLRRTPLRRKTWMKRSRSSSKYRRRPRDLAYMLWVKRQPCAARDVDHNCDGRVEADHAGRRGLGQKADDRTCIPMCKKHHEQRASFHGPFKDWDHERMRGWLQAEVELHQFRYSEWTDKR